MYSPPPASTTRLNLIAVIIGAVLLALGSSMCVKYVDVEDEPESVTQDTGGDYK